MDHIATLSGVLVVEYELRPSLGNAAPRISRKIRTLARLKHRQLHG